MTSPICSNCEGQGYNMQGFQLPLWISSLTCWPWAKNNIDEQAIYVCPSYAVFTLQNVMRTRNSVSDHYETVSMNNHKGSLKHCWVNILEKIIISKSFGALSWNSCQRVGQIRFPDLISMSQSKSNCTRSTPLVIQASKRNSIKFLCHKSLCCSVIKFP